MPNKKGEDNTNQLPTKVTFEDSIDIIDREIAKRKGKWTLNAISWMDYEDVAQIIRIHIYKKWHMYDSTMPLSPWLNRIISRQIKNLIRNHYGNYIKPCVRCHASFNDNQCKIYGVQDAACPQYFNWLKSKANAYHTKLPVSIEKHQKEINTRPCHLSQFNYDVQELHYKMEKVLSKTEWRVYKMLYIDLMDESEVTKTMKLTSNEKGRTPGYKWLTNIKSSIIEKVKKQLKKDI